MSAPSPFTAEGLQFAQLKKQKVQELLEKAKKQGDCLICHLRPNAKGYPSVLLGGRSGVKYRANRLVCEVIHGLREDQQALHRCHNRACINPEHLYAGTAWQNSQDMVRANRQARLGKPPVPNAELERTQRLRDAGFSYSEIADQLGIAMSTVAYRLKRLV